MEEKANLVAKLEELEEIVALRGAWHQHGARLQRVLVCAIACVGRNLLTGKFMVTRRGRQQMVGGG